MDEIGTCIATKLAECVWGPISRDARYLFCFKKFIGDVEKAKQELEVKLADMNKRKEEANRKTEEIMPSVRKWLDDVNAILEEVHRLKQELEGEGNKCFNVSLRYSLAKQMDDKAKQMMDLKSNSSFEPFSQLIQIPGISTQFSSQEIMDFKSRKSTYENLLEAIKDGKNKMVGLYGMGGSGKTTLAIEVGKKVEQLKLFDKVINVVVSRPPNVRNIQEEIKGKASLKFQEETESATAERLLIGLKSMKILIILDDVWSNLNLQEVGIPLNENCRILLTTRSRDVCDSMCCDRKFELSILTKEEAWALLKMHARLTNDSLKEFDGVGSKIVDECKGLPIAIVTVGRALREKGIVEWKSTLGRLQRSQPLEIDESSRGPYACLKLSYDNLPSLAKPLFLLCSMFPEDHEIHIEDLIRFSKGTLAFAEINVYTMEDARSEILVSINRLLDSCLLMHANKQACVKMHDLVRDVALWISKNQHQAIFVDSNAVSRMLVENQSLKDTKVISLWNLEKNFTLSNQLRCPTLEVLLLHPKGFIEDLGGIEALKVLALGISSFKWTYNIRSYQLIRWSMAQSSNVSSLINLHTICFRGIELGDISFICQLKRLEILDLHASQFDELPDGIVDMKKLKLLDVFQCEIRKSPLEVIERCKQLEELYLWATKSAIPENFSLSGLKRYVIQDSTLGNTPFSKYPHHPPIHVYFDACIEALRALCIQGFKVSALNSSMKDLIFRANCLYLKNCWWDHKHINCDIKHLAVSHCQEKTFIVDNLGANILETQQMFSQLISLRLIEMNSLEQVFQDSCIRCCLPMLQELYIESCPKLTTIFTHSTVTSLAKLRKLEITKCNKVKWLFSYSLVSCCPSLEELKILKCSGLERLIDEEAMHGDRLLRDMQDYSYGNEAEKAYVVLTPFPSLKVLDIALSGIRTKAMFEVQVRGTIEGKESIEPQEEPLKVNSELCYLWLRHLTELEYIWKGPTQSVNLHRLEELQLWGCPRLRNIFTLAIVTNLPELKWLLVYGCEEWEGVFCEESFKNLSSSSNVCFPMLKAIVITGSNKVKWLFSYSLASHCPLLERLEIKDCSELERLVDEEAAHGHRLPLLQLEKLDLRKLPKLREIFGGGLECQQQKNENERLKVVNSELRSIYLNELSELEYIWKAPTQSVNLHRLESVGLWNCSKLKNTFTLTIVTSLPELRRLKIERCEEWEGIFCEESLKYLSSSSSNVCFPKLKDIWIGRCNKVKRLFSYYLAFHCPSLKEMTIYDCSQLEAVVQAYEGDEVAVHHQSLFTKLSRLNLTRLPKLREIYSGYEFNHLSHTIHIQDCPNICGIPL